MVCDLTFFFVFITLRDRQKNFVKELLMYRRLWFFLLIPEWTMSYWKMWKICFCFIYWGFTALFWPIFNSFIERWRVILVDNLQPSRIQIVTLHKNAISSSYNLLTRVVLIIYNSIEIDFYIWNFVCVHKHNVHTNVSIVFSSSWFKDRMNKIASLTIFLCV